MSEPTPEQVANAAVGEVALSRAIASSGLHAARGEADRHGATDAEVTALRWLFAMHGETFPSSALARLYEVNYRGACYPEGRRPHVGSRRMGGWRRASGSVLARMRRKGLVECALADGWSRRYRITDAGREAIA